MSDPQPTPPTPPPVGKPKRAAAPVAKPAAPTLNAPGAIGPRRRTQSPVGVNAPSDALSELAAIAGSTVAPSTQSPSGSSMSALRASMPTFSESAAARQAAANRATLAPPCLTLGITLPLLGIAWFTLERHRVLRDNPIGVGLPILLFVGGAIFLGLFAAMILSDGRRRRAANPSTDIETTPGGTSDTNAS